MGWVIRRFHEGDAGGVWALHNAALAGTGAHAGNGPWDADLRAVSDHYLARGDEFLVAVEGATVIAMGALVRRGEGTGEIKRMRVEPARQRSGVGSAVLRALEGAALSRGWRHLVLDTTTAQTTALAFYAKHGYREIGRRQRGPFTCVDFEKTFAGGAVRGGNLFRNAAADGETIAPLLDGAGFRLEHIVSRGDPTPEGAWYDQACDEWVALLRGTAELTFTDQPPLALEAGDWVMIPAGCRHRVGAVSADAVWLALHRDGANPV